MTTEAAPGPDRRLHGLPVSRPVDPRLLLRLDPPRWPLVCASLVLALVCAGFTVVEGFHTVYFEPTNGAVYEAWAFGPIAQGGLIATGLFVTALIPLSIPGFPRTRRAAFGVIVVVSVLAVTLGIRESYERQHLEPRLIADLTQLQIVTASPVGRAIDDSSSTTVDEVVPDATRSFAVPGGTEQAACLAAAATAARGWVVASQFNCSFTRRVGRVSLTMSPRLSQAGDVWVVEVVASPADE